MTITSKFAFRNIKFLMVKFKHTMSSRQKLKKVYTKSNQIFFECHQLVATKLAMSSYNRSNTLGEI